MVKVTRGSHAAARTGGYSLYSGGFGRSQGFGVRRTVPTNKTQTSGASLQQSAQKKRFRYASLMYSGFTWLQKDFYRRSYIIVKELDQKGHLKKRLIWGRQLAIRDIISQLASEPTGYQPPIPFCICAIDETGNPVLHTSLTITAPKPWVFTYTEKADKTGCFPPSALSPEQGPYILQCKQAPYGPWTAKQIHKTKTIYCTPAPYYHICSIHKQIKNNDYFLCGIDADPRLLYRDIWFYADFEVSDMYWPSPHGAWCASIVIRDGSDLICGKDFSTDGRWQIIGHHWPLHGSYVTLYLDSHAYFNLNVHAFGYYTKNPQD